MRKKTKSSTDGPEYLDIVRNKKTKIVGTVIAKYPVKGFIKDGVFIRHVDGAPLSMDMVPMLTKLIIKQFGDIRTKDNRIWYDSPLENWEVAKRYDN